MKVVLIGMKHCGKSTLGVALANQWGCLFRDVDQLIEKRHASATGQQLTTREIFNTFGENHFTQLETDAVYELYLCHHDDPGPLVVAAGGRTALNDRVADLLSGIGTVVYLEVSPEEMFRRVLRGGLPSFINQEDPLTSFRKLYQERAPYYRRRAELTVNIDNLTVAESVAKLCCELDRFHQKARP